MIPLPDMSRGRVSYTNDLLRDILELSFWMDVSSTIMTTSRRRERERRLSKQCIHAWFLLSHSRNLCFQLLDHLRRLLARFWSWR